MRLAGATGHRSVALAAGQQAALAAAALGTGAVFALSAFVVGPLVLPAAMAFCALAAVTVARPEVGIAAAFMMVPLANLGLTGNPPWALGAVWSVFLVAVAFLQRRDGLHEQRLPRLSLGLLVYGLIAMVGAFTVADSLRDAQPILRSLLTGLLMFAAIAKTVRTRAHVQWVMAGIATGALLTGSFALWEYFSGASSTVGFLTSSGAVVGRATAGFAQPNQLAGFLIILIPFAIAGVAIGWRLKLLYAVAAVMAVVGVYVSFSRGALIGLALIPLVFLGGRRTLLFAPLVLMVGFLITPGILAERFGTLTASGSEIASRLDIWKTAGSIWAENPVTGVGPGQFPEAYAQARVPGKEFLPATLFEPPPHAHNLPLHVLAEGGLFAAVALAAILVVAFRTAFELKRSDQRWIRVLGRATLAALAAFLVHNMFDVTLLEGTGIYFWALLGLISALYSISSGRSVQTEQAEPA